MSDFELRRPKLVKRKGVGHRTGLWVRLILQDGTQVNGVYENTSDLLTLRGQITVVFDFTRHTYVLRDLKEAVVLGTIGLHPMDKA